MRAFGLTGSIGCGKSTVAALLDAYPDTLVIDTDRLAKDIIVRQEHRDAVNSALGCDVFAGAEVFPRIAEIIFNDAERKVAFDRLVHPLVWAEVEKQVEASPEKICVVESALIFETASEGKFLAVAVAACNPSEQLRRLVEDRNMSLEKAKGRVAMQLPAQVKEDMADMIIRTDCPKIVLAARADSLYRVLKKWKGEES